MSTRYVVLIGKLSDSDDTDYTDLDKLAEFWPVNLLSESDSAEERIVKLLNFDLESGLTARELFGNLVVKTVINADNASDGDQIHVELELSGDGI